MSSEIIAIIITSIIPAISLIITIKTYVINKPKVKIELTDKDCDAYYGLVCVGDKTELTKIGAVELNIINSSPVDIGIRDIRLKVDKNYHRLIDKDNPHWDDAYFYYNDDNNEKIWDGSDLSYKERGISTPNNIKAYSILSGLCLFHDFPNIEAKQKRCKLILYTAIGKISKRINLKKYDETYISSEWKDIKLFQKSCIDHHE